MIEAVLCLLVFHGIIGGLDVMVNHEAAEHLPQQAWARHEQVLHSLRELAFAMLFAGLGWLQWNGAFAWVIAAIVVAEFTISFVDTLLEDKIRRLPQLERALHTILFINFGAYTALLAYVLVDWHAAESAVRFAYHGVLSWALGALALGSFAWCVRDAVSARRLMRSAERGAVAAAGTP
ncbi:hypothetical protein E4K72_07615 [Oxalobacteraceae bacterium OM1]|nr:hypothetical protein E4K72_07615 [Oxalobacteraceae bacterium OM1]